MNLVLYLARLLISCFCLSFSKVVISSLEKHFLHTERLPLCERDKLILLCNLKRNLGLYFLQLAHLGNISGMKTIMPNAKE
jgi:hypothetical protein